MFPSSIKSTALVLLTSTLAHAFDEISAPSTITADVSAQIRLTASSFDSQFDLYRVYLAMTPPGWGTGPACYLVNSSSTSIVDFNVAIPASVGPSGSEYYSISIMEFNSDPNAESSSSGFSYSSNFDFEGGTGNWSEYETSGHTVSDADTLPCSAYDCARFCSQKYYPADLSDTDISGYKAAYECIGRCPGVVQDEFEGATVTTAGGGSSGVSTTATGVSTTAAWTSSGATATGTGSTATQSTMASSVSRTSSATTGSNSASSATSAASTSTNASVQMKTGGGLLALVAGVFALVL